MPRRSSSSKYSCSFPVTSEKNWTLYSRQNVNQLEFPFTTEREGEFWFCLKTLDRNRNLLPPGNPHPELKITVDLQRPKMDFRIQADKAGRIVCRWDVTDSQLEANSLAIAYRADQVESPHSAEANWKFLPDNPELKISQNRATGQIAFWPETNSSRLTVRLSVKDQAGNSTRLDRQIVVPKVSWRNSSQNTAIKNQTPRQISVQPPTKATSNPTAVATQSDVSAEKNRTAPICENGVCRLPGVKEGQGRSVTAHLPSKTWLKPLAFKKAWSSDRSDRTASLNSRETNGVQRSNRDDRQSGSPKLNPDPHGVSESQATPPINSKNDLYAQVAQSPSQRKPLKTGRAKNLPIDWEGADLTPTTRRRQQVQSTLDPNEPPVVPSQLWKPNLETNSASGRKSVLDTKSPNNNSKTNPVANGQVRNKQYISESTTRTRTPEFVDRKLRQQNQLGPTSVLGPQQTGSRSFQQTSSRAAKKGAKGKLPNLSASAS